MPANEPKSNDCTPDVLVCDNTAARSKPAQKLIRLIFPRNSRPEEMVAMIKQAAKECGMAESWKAT
jgi:hypothetical protein